MAALVSVLGPLVPAVLGVLAAKIWSGRVLLGEHGETATASAIPVGAAVAASYYLTPFVLGG